MPREIQRLAESWMFDPEMVKVRAATMTVDTVEQFYVEVAQREKTDALARVLQSERPDQAIIFVRTKIGVDRLARSLGDRGLRVKALHGDMSQGSRDGVMIAFKGGRERLLIATDIAARGLDISGVSHVVNYDIPNSPDVYVHRVGRTARVGRAGRAITLIAPKQRDELEAIERHAGTEIHEWSANGSGPTRRQAEDEAERPQPRRPRHTKPRKTAPDGRTVKLAVSAGRAQGIEPADVVSAVVKHTHLDGEDVRNARVLERFSLVEVPLERADEVAKALSATSVRGVELKAEVVAG